MLDGIKTKNIMLKKLKRKIDYAKAIFGFTNFNYKDSKQDNNLEITKSYKGRVSFTNAKPVQECYKQVEKPVYKHLMNPKISSFQLYLKQEVNNPKKLKHIVAMTLNLEEKSFIGLEINMMMEMIMKKIKERVHLIKTSMQGYMLWIKEENLKEEFILKIYIKMN